jgi:hypothetical protein
MKSTRRKIFIEIAKRERRMRKILRRQKRHMPAKNNPTQEPGGELGKYANLCNQLEADVAQLTGLHKQQAELVGQQSSLAITRGRLSQSILDQEAPIETLSESLGELETERLVLEASLEALAPRIARLETELHATLPLALQTFGRLREYVVSQVLESCRHQVRSLVEPGLSVALEHVDALAISLPAFVAVSRLNLPGLSWSWTRELDPVPMHWSSLVRPLSEAERALERSETIKSMVDAGNALILAARPLISAATPYVQDVPEFKCEAEPVEPATVDPKFLEWQLPLGGSDADFIREVCKQGGRDPDNLCDRDKEILAGMLEQRHAHPISHGIVTGEMLGSTFVER